MFHFIFRTVGVASFLQCSRCDAHIGLLTQDDDTGELQYYANGIAMTFSPRDKQAPIMKEMPNKLSNETNSEMGFKDISRKQFKMTMDQLWQRAGTGRNLS